jgi:hypothetical protein
MTALTSGDIDAIWIEIMKDYSREKKPMPVTSDKIRAFFVTVDAALEQAEIDIVQSLPAGDIKTWLIANAEVGREIMIRVMQKRQEVL